MGESDEIRGFVMFFSGQKYEKRKDRTEMPRDSPAQKGKKPKQALPLLDKPSIEP
jgi:hypothetical protein